MARNIVPRTDKGSDLGTPTKRWNNVYTDKLEATIVNGGNLGAVEQSAGDEVTLRSLIAAAGSDPTSITIYNDIPITTTDLTIPSNIHLNFKDDGKLSPEAGITLAINGSIGAGLWQIFGISGYVTGNILNEIVLPEWFGADYVDDTIAFAKAASLSLDSQKPLILQDKTYKIFESSLTDELKIAYEYEGIYRIPIYSIIGFPVASIELTGKIAFNTAQAPYIDVENLTLLIKDHYYTENSPSSGIGVASYGTVFFDGIEPSNHDKVIFRNIKMTADVTNPSDYATLQSGPPGIWVYTNSGIFEDIEMHDMSLGIVIKSGSRNFSIRNCYFYNVDTAIWVIYGDHWSVENVSAVNDYYRQFIWVAKNTGTRANGKDLILCEGGNDYKLNNLYAECLPERCVYSQGSNVIASNLKAVNTGGFKFVGSETNIAHNVSCSDATQIIDNEGFTITRPYEFTHIYYINNISFNDCKLIVKNSNYEATLAGPAIIFLIDMQGNVKDVSINGFCGYVNGAKGLCGVVLKDTTESLPEDYLVAENIHIKNCKLIGDESYSPLLFSAYTNLASSGALANVAAKNVEIIDCVYSFITSGGGTRAPIYDIRFVDGFRGVNNRVLGKYLQGSSTKLGFEYDSNITKNIFLDEKFVCRFIGFAPTEDIVSMIENLPLLAQSNIIFEDYAKYSLYITFNPYDGRTYKLWEVFMGIPAGEYREYFIPWDTYTAEVKTQEHWFILKVANDAGTVIHGTAPVANPVANFVFADTTNKKIIFRGDLYPTYNATCKITHVSAPPA